MTFRARLALTMGALILAIAVAMWFLVPRALEQEAITLTAHRAETLAHLTAFTIHPSIYFRDQGALEEALSGARQDEDVAYIVVIAPDGRRLAAFHAERASAAALGRRSMGGGISREGSLYEVMTPVLDRGQELARLYIGMSLARVNREISRTRLTIGIIGAVILAAGLLAVVVISNVMTRPLRHVAAGAGRIAAGDFAHRVPEASDDEIGRLATAFNDMAEKVAERDASLRLLSKRLLAAQERERVRIAREVHDELGQALTALKIDLQQAGSPHARSIDAIIELVRRIATDLRPSVLDDLGITAALEQQLRRLRESTGMKTTLRVSEEPQLDMLTGVTLYRIAQEGLANVVRHAGASEVEVSLEVSESAAALEIRDNGRGITREQVAGSQSLGLVGIRERAELLGGSVNIEGQPGEGTVLTVTLPLAKDDRNAASVVR
ncbi:MAG TPA: HAMP domain-containing protein [Thermoanaerobaculia bacterium]|nr:HAMP domain-containing protein [Thermoanaerobaculia bacterium]